MGHLNRLALKILLCCTVLSLFGGSIPTSAKTPFQDHFLIKTLLAINLFYVKKIWGWTLLFLTSFSVLHTVNIQSHSSINFRSRKRKPINYFEIVHPFSRIFIGGTLIWWIFTLLKRYVFESTGFCLLEEDKIILAAEKPYECRQLSDGKADWTGYNISGHSFMLNFVSLVILSEIEPYVFFWEY